MNLLRKVSSKALGYQLPLVPILRFPSVNSTKSGVRGQASIEFVLVLLFMLVLILSVIIPLGEKMQDALEDVSTVGSLSAGLSQFEQSFSVQTSIPGSSRKTVSIFLPADTNWLCNPATDSFSVSFALNTSVYDTNGSIPAQCEDPLVTPGLSKMRCTKTLSLSPHTLSCQGSLATNFGLEVGSTGFTQRFSIDTTYSSSPTPSFTVNVDAMP